MTATAPVRVAGRPALRRGRFSGVLRPRTIAVTVLGLALVLLAAAVNIGRGDFPISIGEVLAVLLGGGERGQRFIVLDLRLPRSLTGVLVGAALGLAGAITQTVARNPLASPDVLGVTSGASAAAVLLIVLGGSSAGVAAIGATLGLPLAALLGGLLTAVLVHALAWRRRIEGQRLVLVGVGVAAVGTALTNWLLTRAEITDAARATVWLTGSLNARGWEHVVPVGAALVVLVPVALLLGFGLGALQLGDDTARGLGLRVDRERAALLVLVPVALLLGFGLGALQLGDDTARGLGLRVDRERAALVVVAVALAAVATASAGPIAFVALVVPQICQRLVGAARPPLLASAVYGALLVLVADLVARTVLAVELPVGIVTAILGAPYLLFLLTRGVRA